MKFYSVLLLLLSITVIMYSCNDDDIATPILCENGFVSNGEGCECPEGNVTAYDICVELNENQYYGITDGCPCIDTLIWTLYDTDDAGIREARINENLPIGTTNPSAANRLRQDFLLHIVQTPAGDSLYVLNDGIQESGLIVSCNALTDDDLNEGVYFNGLLSSDEKTISATLTYRDNEDPTLVIGTCTVDFVKK